MPSRAVDLAVASTLLAGSFVVASVALQVPPRSEACCTGGAGGDGEDSGGSPTVTSWVAGATNGGVSRPSGTSSCTGWQPDSGFGTETTGEQGVLPSEATADGRVWKFWFRTCDGVVQNVWAPDYSPEDLAQIAMAEVEKNLPRPAPSTSPANDVGGFVTLETWLQVDAEIDVSATAGPLPDGLTATTTATPSAIEWSPIPGGEKIVCDLWGALPSEAQIESDAAAPCGWLPPGPSAPQYGAGGDLRFHGEVVLVWTVAWAATNGTGGDLGELRSTADWSYRVREIQTIGEDR